MAALSSQFGAMQQQIALADDANHIMLPVACTTGAPLQPEQRPLAHAVKVIWLPVVHRTSFPGISRLAVSRKLDPPQSMGIKWSMLNIFSSAKSSGSGALLRELLSRGVLAMPTVTVVGPIDRSQVPLTDRHRLAATTIEN